MTGCLRQKQISSSAQLGCCARKRPGNPSLRLCAKRRLEIGTGPRSRRSDSILLSLARRRVKVDRHRHVDRHPDRVAPEPGLFRNGDLERPAALRTAAADRNDAGAGNLEHTEQDQPPPGSERHG